MSLTGIELILNKFDFLNLDFPLYSPPPPSALTLPKVEIIKFEQ